MEWDLVIYPDDVGEWSVGKVETIDLDDGECVVQPLFEEADEQGERTRVWLESHSRPPRTVKLSDIRCVLDADFAQRMAPDRVSNPHGEHAEDFWEITAELPPGTRRDDD
jgi:hypothetical protein